MSEKRTFRERASLFGRIFKYTVLTATIVLIVGLLLGWFTFSVHESDTESDDRFSIVFTVNQDAFWSSANEAKDEAVGLKDAVTQASKLQTVDGVITNIDREKQQITIAPDGKSSEKTTVQLNEESEIRLGDGESKLEALSEGDEVSITFIEKDDVKRVKKISQL